MFTGHLGIVGFFGILVPGTYLVGVTVLGGAILIINIGNTTSNDVLEFAVGNVLALGSSFLLISYLVGVLLRLLGPDKIDRLSSRYFLAIKKKKDRKFWHVERFPYRRSMASGFERLGMAGLNSFLSNLNPQYGLRGNTTYFNYCKIVATTNNPLLAQRIDQAEAMVRFLSGSAMALIASGVIWGVIAGFFIFLSPSIAALGLFGLAVSVVLIIPILQRYKHQRRREIQLVWLAVYALCHDAIPLDSQVSKTSVEAALRTMT